MGYMGSFRCQFAFGMLLGCAALPGLGAEPSIDLTTPQITSMSGKAQRLLAEMQKAGESMHLKFVGPSKFSPDWGMIDPELDGMLSMTGTQVQLGTKAYSFHFGQADSQITSFQNELTDDLPENKIYYDPADKPTWTPQHAIEVATVFEKIFVDPKGALLGTPRAQYDHMFGNTAGGKTKWQLGMWMVSWPRVDSHGHPFYGDHVSVEIQEGFCPLGIAANLSTPFTEQKGAPLTAAIALGKAESTVGWRQFGEKIFYNCVIADQYQRNVTGDYLLGQQLVVVIPHTSKPKEARLAWEIWFRPRHAKPPSGSWYDEDFSVWIDAYTGSVIGGDAML